MHPVRHHQDGYLAHTRDELWKVKSLPRVGVIVVHLSRIAGAILIGRQCILGEENVGFALGDLAHAFWVNVDAVVCLRGILLLD